MCVGLSPYQNFPMAFYLFTSRRGLCIVRDDFSMKINGSRIGRVAIIPPHCRRIARVASPETLAGGGIIYRIPIYPVLIAPTAMYG